MPVFVVPFLPAAHEAGRIRGLRVRRPGVSSFAPVDTTRGVNSVNAARRMEKMPRCSAAEGRVKCVEVTGIQVVLYHAQGLAETLVMYDFAFPQETDGGDNVGVVDKL